ncbi:MAG: beta-1,6-N-acetylglucosaminyltransferase [Ferruginibacter sp.]
MKFAYLIFVHKNPQQFTRLLQRLDTPESLFFVHVDKKADEAAFREVLAVVDEQKIVWLKRWNIVWAGFNSIRATLHGLQVINDHPENISHISFISGQDYPLKPVEAYHAFLLQHPQKSFLEYSPLPRPGWQNGGLDRIHYYHVYFNSFKLAFPPVSFLKTKLPHATQKKWQLLKKIIPYVPSAKPFPRSFLEGYKPYEGSSWFTFSKQFVQDLFDELATNEAYTRFFKYTQCADEIFFQTLLLNRLGRQLPLTENNNLRHIVFDSTTGRPYDYTIEHFESLKNSPAFFARKFDEVKSSGLMDKIDADLLQRREVQL